MIDVAEVTERLAAVTNRLERAGAARDIEILAVTKGFGPEVIDVAAAAGCSMIGENYAQELLAKRDAIAAAGIRQVHFIGRLQSNKVRQLVDVVDVYESVDRASLARELARRAPGARVLIQVDTTGDPDKGGCAPDEVERLVADAGNLGLVVEGLMTVGPTTGGPEAARPGFRHVRALVDRMGLTVCSMGMSGDLEVAVGEGSTRVRIGSALFGDRPQHR